MSACFSPTLVNAARVAFPPSRHFDVTAARLRTWMEEWSGSDRAPSSSSACPPPSTSSSYLPASLDDRQAAARRPAAARRAVSEPGRRLTFFHRRFFAAPPSARPSPRAGQRVRSRPGNYTRVPVLHFFASFVFLLPFKTYGENGQTSSHKSNFPAADSRRPQIAAGKPAQAALPPRRR